MPERAPGENGRRCPYRYPEYLTSYDWARRRFIQTLGVQRYNDRMAGRDIVLNDGHRLASNNR